MTKRESSHLHVTVRHLSGPARLDKEIAAGPPQTIWPGWTALNCRSQGAMVIGRLIAEDAQNSTHGRTGENPENCSKMLNNSAGVLSIFGWRLGMVLVNGRLLDFFAAKPQLPYHGAHVRRDAITRRDWSRRSTGDRRAVAAGVRRTATAGGGEDVARAAWPDAASDGAGPRGLPCGWWMSLGGSSGMAAGISSGPRLKRCGGFSSRMLAARDA